MAIEPKTVRTVVKPEIFLVFIASFLVLKTLTLIQCESKPASAFSIWSERESSSPIFLEILGENWREIRADDECFSFAKRSVFRGVARAELYVSLSREENVLLSAAQANKNENYETGLRLALRVLEVDHPAEVRLWASDIAGYSALQLQEGSTALFYLIYADEHVGAEDPMKSHRDLWIAEAALLDGQPELAQMHAERSLESMPFALISHSAKFALARANLLFSATRSLAIERLDELLVEYPEYPRRDREIIALAAAEIAEGRYEDAASRLDSYVWERPYWPYAEDARELREELAQEHGILLPNYSLSDRYDQARELRRERHWEVAGDLFISLLEEIDVENVRLANETRFQLVLNNYDRGDFEEALVWLDRIEANGSDGVSSSNRAKWRARTLSRLNRQEEAYQGYLSHFGENLSTSAHRTLYEFAFDLGLWEEAYSHMDAFTSNSEWRSWDGAFLAYLSGRLETAESRFSYLASHSSGNTRARYVYWLARTEIKLGKTEEAQAHFREIANNSAFRYYGLLSQNRLTDLQEDGTFLSRPGRIHWNGAFETNTTNFRVVSGGESFSSYHSALLEPAGIIEFAENYGELFYEGEIAASLYRIGAAEDARVIFRDAAIEYRSLDRLFRSGRRSTTANPIRLDQTLWAHEIDNRRHHSGWWGIRLHELRYPYPSSSEGRTQYVERHQAITNIRSSLREGFLGALRSLDDHFLIRRMAYATSDLSIRRLAQTSDLSGWYQAYPRPMADLVGHWAQHYNLNPYLIWSLIIVESDMNPDSISHADAYGLLQVIPKTGNLIALRANQADFGIHELLDPRASIQYGSYYFNELLEKFHGQEILAMIAYNAGPHQVQRWLEWRGDQLDIDEFVETVPYDGARRYPQRALRYMSIYRYLYHEEEELYIGLELDPTFEDNIYF